MKWNYNTKYCELIGKNNNVLADVFEYHKSMLGYYEKTLEKKIGKEVYVKDESDRMNTGSFKILGVSYSIYKKYEDKCNGKGFLGLIEYFSTKNITFVTASDGNFGIAMSYFCNLLQQKCIVFVPQNTPEFYIKKIKINKTEIIFDNEDYDECVDNAIRYSKHNCASLILDTSILNVFMDDIAKNVIKGYTTLFFESRRHFDYIFAPAGVGGVLAAAIQYNMYVGNPSCKVISVEPESYNAIQVSIIKGEVSKVNGGNTVMNGLKCGRPSWFAWEYIHKGLYGSISISDSECINAKMELEKMGLKTGYTGASAYAGYKMFCRERIEDLKNKKILILNTERSDY